MDCLPGQRDIRTCSLGGHLDIHGDNVLLSFMGRGSVPCLVISDSTTLSKTWHSIIATINQSQTNTVCTRLKISEWF